MDSFLVGQKDREEKPQNDREKKMFFSRHPQSKSKYLGSENPTDKVWLTSRSTH